MDYIKKNGSMKHFHYEKVENNETLLIDQKVLQNSKIFNSSLNHKEVPDNNIPQALKVLEEEKLKIFFSENKINFEGIKNHFIKRKELASNNFSIENFQSHRVKEKLNSYLDSYVHYVKSVEERLSMLKKTFFHSSFKIDNSVMTKLHPEFKKEYLPVYTSGDGNCIYNMISIALFGSIENATFLRYLTLCCLLKYEENYKEIIKKNYLSSSTFSEAQLKEYVNIKYAKLLYDARQNGIWGNEYHLSALSTVLKTNIYIYSAMRGNEDIVTSHDLLNRFNYRNSNMCHSIIYTPINPIQVDNYICGFYDTKTSTKNDNSIYGHYTALIPTKLNSLEFRPIFKFLE
ncbi:unnamed protein product [Brachionus calyciflorus]|nr:unnamed protein product [Brachionus calyciflorus]